MEEELYYLSKREKKIISSFARGAPLSIVFCDLSEYRGNRECRCKFLVGGVDKE